jgi:hypothetical protein
MKGILAKKIKGLIQVQDKTESVAVVPVVRGAVATGRDTTDDGVVGGVVVVPAAAAKNTNIT